MSGSHDTSRPLRVVNAVAPIRICDNGGWTDTWFAKHGKIFNIGGGHTIDLIDAIRIMESVSGERAIINYTEAGAGDTRRTSADISLAAKELGYQPSVDIEEGLAAEIEWLRATTPATLNQMA